MFNIITRTTETTYVAVYKRYVYCPCFCILDSGKDKQ